MARQAAHAVSPLAVLALALLALPWPARAWGPTAHRVIVNRAIDTLPAEMRPFFEANRGFFSSQNTETAREAASKPLERTRHAIYLDRYGNFPYVGLPRDYNQAVRKYSASTIRRNGVLPWQVGLYSLKLTNAFKARNWDEVRSNAAALAYYVAEAHDPFNTTQNFDGRLSAQYGVDNRYGSSLVDRYSMFFAINPADATKVDDPTLHAFDMVLEANSWLDNVQLADLRARAGLSDYTDEFYDRFYNQAGAVLVKQINDACHNAGSYWYTAWLYAGRPPLPPR